MERSETRRGRARTDPAIPTHLIGPLLKVLRARGVDPLRLIRRFRLPADAEELPEVALSISDFGALLETTAAWLDDPHFVLTVPEQLELPRYTLSELAARAAATLREASERMVRYGSLVNAAVIFGLEERDGEARFTHHYAGHPRGVGRCMNELSVALAFHHSRRQVGAALPVRAIDFIHPRSGDLARLRAHFGVTAIHFGREKNALVLDAAAMDLPVLTRDPRLLATADALAQAALVSQPRLSDFSSRVCAQLRRALESGPLHVRRIALAFRMSTRTLQRRLEEEGTSFATLLEAVREDIARDRVAHSDVPLGEIAYALGFSEFSTFARAFKRWTGESPGAFRNGHMGEGHGLG